MKTGKRFVFFFAAAISICCALCVLCSVLSLDRMRENNNRNVIQLISSVRARVPDITDAEIMQMMISALPLRNRDKRPTPRVQF